MLKIKDKSIDYSENVETSIDRVALGQPGQIIVQHRMGVKVTFKDWLKCFLGKDLIHTSTTTIIEYEEINNINTTSNSSSDKPNSIKKSKSKKDNSSSTTKEQSSKSE